MVHHWLGRLHKASVLAEQRALRPLVIHIKVSHWRLLFLFARASCDRRVSNRKFPILTLRDVARFIGESVLEYPMLRLRSSELLSLLAQLLELESLEVDLLEALHAGVVLDGTLEGALGDLGEAGKRLHFEVTSVDELVYVFLVNLLELFLKCSIVFGHLKGVGGRVRKFNLRLGRLLFPLVFRRRPLIPKVVHSRGTLSSFKRFVYVLDFLVLIPPP